MHPAHSMSPYDRLVKQAAHSIYVAFEDATTPETALADALRASLQTLPKPESKTNTEYDRGYRHGVALIRNQLALITDQIENRRLQH
jgi:hypothetical protein